MNMAGRPTKYKAEYAKEAGKLCALGATDAQLADFFEVGLDELAIWAWENQSFFDSITQTPEQIASYHGGFERIREKRRQTRQDRSTPAHRVRNSFRARFWAAIKGRRKSRVFSECGYTLAELVAHLESRFHDGMSWDNYGEWHIDHVKPCALFDHSNKGQIVKCWDLSNLQPLWASDNVKKGAKYASA